MVMPYHLHMPSYFLETFTEYPYSVAVWSPRLNPKGNSVMGIKALELLTTQTQESIF